MFKFAGKLYKNFARKVNETILDISFEANKNYELKERIKVVFFFQSASFWASWESFFEECKKDDRLEIKTVLFDKDFSGKSQMKTARKFLEQRGIEFTDYENYDFEGDSPDIAVLQTPYDHIHRPVEIWSKVLKLKGIRVVYIPYGIEISDTENVRKFHFAEGVPLYAWKVYTFSELIRQDYIKYSRNAEKRVQVLGQPKFDGLFHKQTLPLPDEIKNRAKGRKIVLWKVHFPKQENIYSKDKKSYYVTPDFEEYKQFLAKIPENPDLFFIFRPHPNFFDMCLFNGVMTVQETEEMKQNLNSTENLYYDTLDDYRITLVNSDCIIIDRSSLMVEASVTGVPILYMHNKSYYEPLTRAISGLIKSYYQGSTAKDMLAFLQMFRRGEDLKKQERISATQKHIPFFDGNSGKRIKENMILEFDKEIKCKNEFKIKIFKKIVQISKIKEILEENQLNTKQKVVKFLKKHNFQNHINLLAHKYKNKKIFLYGAGMFFDAISENFDLSGLKIIGIADKKFIGSEKNKGYECFSAKNFLEHKPDMVLTCMLEKEIADNYFVKELFPIYGRFDFKAFIPEKWNIIDKVLS